MLVAIGTWRVKEITEKLHCRYSTYHTGFPVPGWYPLPILIWHLLEKYKLWSTLNRKRRMCEKLWQQNASEMKPITKEIECDKIELEEGKWSNTDTTVLSVLHQSCILKILQMHIIKLQVLNKWIQQMQAV